MHLNSLQHISRAHQLCMEGYQVLFRERFSTVWSAPNYCHRFGNLAAVMSVNEQLEVCPDTKNTTFLIYVNISMISTIIAYIQDI